MISGAHVIVSSNDAEADGPFFASEAKGVQCSKVHKRALGFSPESSFQPGDLGQYEPKHAMAVEAGRAS